MKVKQIIPLRKGGHKSDITCYVKIGIKMLYISNEAMKLFGDVEYIRISLDMDNRKVIISKAYDKEDDTFKLSKVNETKLAKRIETNRALLALVQAGFPMYMIDKYLPVEIGLDGSLLADFSMLVPLKGGAET